MRGSILLENSLDVTEKQIVDGKINNKQMKEVIQQSGYFLKQRIQPILGNPFRTDKLTFLLAEIGKPYLLHRDMTKGIT